MDEPRDHFLACTRLAGNQDGRVRRGHLRRLAQHAAPFHGLADHSGVRAVAERVRGISHARVEFPRPGTAIRSRACRGRQLFVRHGDSDVVDDAASQREMGAVVRIGVLRPESQAEHQVARRGCSRQQRPVTTRRQLRRTAPAAKVVGCQVSDDDVLGKRPLERIRLQIIQAGSRRLDDELAVPTDEAHSQRVVREDPLGDLRQPRKDGAHVEHFRDRPQKIRRSRDIRVDGSRCVRGRLSDDGHTRLRFTQHCRPARLPALFRWRLAIQPDWAVRPPRRAKRNDAECPGAASNEAE